MSSTPVALSLTIHCQAGSEYALFIAALLQAEAEYGVRDAQRNYRYEHIAGLHDEIRHAVLGVGEDAGVKRGEEEEQYFRAEGADGEEKRVGEEFPV